MDGTMEDELDGWMGWVWKKHLYIQGFLLFRDFFKRFVCFFKRPPNKKGLESYFWFLFLWFWDDVWNSSRFFKGGLHYIWSISVNSDGLMKLVFWNHWKWKDNFLEGCFSLFHFYMIKAWLGVTSFFLSFPPSVCRFSLFGHMCGKKRASQKGPNRKYKRKKHNQRPSQNAKYLI